MSTETPGPAGGGICDTIAELVQWEKKVKDTLLEIITKTPAYGVCTSGVLVELAQEVHAEHVLANGKESHE
jgi:hypothetical protein